MAPTNAAELANSRDSFVVAPAGCGKTHLIAEAVANHNTGRELILTHTHAGVHSLRQKLKRMNAPSRSFNVETIAGFALRFSSAYRSISGIQNVLPKEHGDYEDVYSSILRLLDNGNIQDILKASFTGVYIDEYQDCTIEQHAIVMKLKNILAVRILGDPLQGIFSFGDNVCCDWVTDVEANFVALEQLDEPWRWKNVGNEELGEWLLDARGKLVNGQQIDFRDSPVDWKLIPRSPGEIRKTQSCLGHEMANREGSGIIIQKWNKQCTSFGKGMRGRYECLEPIDSEDLFANAEKIGSSSGFARSLAVAEFMSACKTDVTSNLQTACKNFENGRAPNLAKCGGYPEAVRALIDVSGNSDFSSVLRAIDEMKKMSGSVYRKELLEEFERGVKEYVEGDHNSLTDAVWHSRNRTRRIGRKLRTNSTGTTLLVKGLEFDHCLVWNADIMGDNKNLYVALTRGARTLTVVSKEQLIGFA